MSIKIITIPVGQMQSNCYILIDIKSNKCIIIDSGDDGEYILTKISENNFKPEKIIATHGHFDHIMAAFYLQQNLQIPFLLHKDDKFLVKNMRDSAMHFLNIEAGPHPEVNREIEDKQKILLGDSIISVIHTRGHTPGSICLYFKKENILFTGDLIFAGGGVGRTDFSYSDPEMMEKSLTKIFKLPLNTIIYPGHGENTTIKDELKIRIYES